MNRSTLLGLGLVLALGSAGEAKVRLAVDLRAFVASGEDLAKGTTFATVRLGAPENTPLEDELLAMARRRLEARGLIYREERPELEVRLFGSIDESGEAVAVETFVPPQRNPTVSATGLPDPAASASQAWTDSTSQSFPDAWVPVSAEGRTRQRYRAQIFVAITRSGTRPAWRGEIATTGFVDDLRKLAPHLLDELLEEFPRGSGELSSRTVKIKKRDFGRGVE